MRRTSVPIASPVWTARRPPVAWSRSGSAGAYGRVQCPGGLNLCGAVRLAGSGRVTRGWGGGLFCLCRPSWSVAVRSSAPRSSRASAIYCGRSKKALSPCLSVSRPGWRRIARGVPQPASLRLVCGSGVPRCVPVVAGAAACREPGAVAGYMGAGLRSACRGPAASGGGWVARRCDAAWGRTVLRVLAVLTVCLPLL